MEDRHTISEARRRRCDVVIGSSNKEHLEEEEAQLEWEVDIIRESIVVDTIVINSNTLPPRRNKKTGKVAWCLPTAAAAADDAANNMKLPSFGSEERRRILDIFRNRRKLRKKSTRTTSSSGIATTNSDNNTNDYHHTASVSERNTNQTKENKKHQQVTLSPSTSTNIHNAPPGFNGTTTARTHTSLDATPPPPGFETGSSTTAINDDTTAPITILHPKYICYIPPPSSPISPSNITQSKQLAKQFLELYYSIFTTTATTTEHHNKLASLLPYYTSTFQKSMSINGIHSVVSSDYLSLVQQLQYVVSTVTLCNIQSVVAQDLIANDGVLIMIAGTAAAAANSDATSDTNGGGSFFSHTVTLVPMRKIPLPTSSSSNNNNDDTATAATITTDITITGYQIHNDAFMLLSSFE